MIQNYRTPTQLLLEPFHKQKDEVFNKLEGYLFLYGCMGEELIDRLGVLPPTIDHFVGCIQEGNPFEVLDALYKIDPSELDLLTEEKAQNLHLLYTQTICRAERPYGLIRLLIEGNWGEPTEEILETLCKLMYPLEYSKGASLKGLIYRCRGKIAILKKIPKDTKVIDYAKVDEYGAVLGALKRGNEKEFFTALSNVIEIRIPLLN